MLRLRQFLEAVFTRIPMAKHCNCYSMVIAQQLS